MRRGLAVRPRPWWNTKQMEEELNTTETMPRFQRAGETARHARSWHLASPLVDQVASHADVCVWDIEDGLPAARRDEGRRRVRNLAQHGSVWLRISPPRTADGMADLALLRDLGRTVDGIVLAMCAGPSDLDVLARTLPDGTPIVPMVETAAALLAAPAIASHPATCRLAFGSGDFCRDTGMSSQREVLAWPRTHLVVASAAAGIAGPIDGPCATPADAGDAATHAATLGFTGTLVLRVEAIEGANRGFMPSPTEVANARALVDRAPSSGGTDGSYAPMLARAEALLERIDALMRL